jgi:hypothetical protein
VNLRLADLWQWQGVLDRAPYLFWGAALSALKYMLDRLLARHVAGVDFNPLHYWIPGDVFGIFTENPERAAAFWPLFVLVLPFVYVGIVLTLRRGRSAGLPDWLVCLFFVPFVNVLYFLVLSILPTRRIDAPSPPTSVLQAVVPQSIWGSAAAAVLITVVPAALFLSLFSNALGHYGWGIFFGLPFVQGFVSAVLHGQQGPRSFGSCAAVSLLALLVTAAALFFLAQEGAICILMAAPLAAPVSLLGALVGYVVHRSSGSSARWIAGLSTALPLLTGAEWLSEPQAALREVTTEIEIDAPPSTVWENVVAFSELPPPDSAWFSAGIAYPIRAEIFGRGPGAIRHCVFSTGPFVEPIEVWDEPRRLKFSVRSQPPAMRELSPWGSIQPPHVDHYLVSEGGQFLLTGLGGGRTRLEGTTWYRHRIFPEFYWRLWTDALIHKIHSRVLGHIRSRSERR